MADVAKNKLFGAAMLPTWPLDEAIEWIKQNLDPEQVFDAAALEKWAIDNGYGE